MYTKYGNATQIIVTQYNRTDVRRARPELGQTDPIFGRFQVINRIEIPKSETTYDNAVQKLFQLDEIYNPFAIYCDRGAGEYQIELLRKKLGDKVKGVHLGSSLEVRDPVSRIFDKKPLKPFIVNQTVLMLERGQIRIPSRGVDETLARQMTNYQVVRYSTKTKEPVYSDVDEHALDALMFTLLAFIQEKPEIAATVEQKPGAKNFATVKQKAIDPFKQKSESSSATESELRKKSSRIRTSSRRNGSDLTWAPRGTNRGMPSRSSW